MCRKRCRVVLWRGERDWMARGHAAHASAVPIPVANASSACSAPGPHPATTTPLPACRVMVMDRLRGVPLTDLDAVRSITSGAGLGLGPGLGAGGCPAAQLCTALELHWAGWRWVGSRGWCMPHLAPSRPLGTHFGGRHAPRLPPPLPPPAAPAVRRLRVSAPPPSHPGVLRWIFPLPACSGAGAGAHQRPQHLVWVCGGLRDLPRRRARRQPAGAARWAGGLHRLWHRGAHQARSVRPSGSSAASAQRGAGVRADSRRRCMSRLRRGLAGRGAQSRPPPAGHQHRLRTLPTQPTPLSTHTHTLSPPSPAAAR